MRYLLVFVLAACLMGCNTETSSSSETSTTNGDGSTTTTKTSVTTKNGVTKGTKTETTLYRDGKISVVNYEKQGGEWVKKN